MAAGGCAGLAGTLGQLPGVAGGEQAVVLALGAFNTIYLRRRQGLTTRFDAGPRRYDHVWLTFLLGSLLLLALGCGVTLRMQRG